MLSQAERVMLTSPGLCGHFKTNMVSGSAVCPLSQRPTWQEKRSFSFLLSLDKTDRASHPCDQMCLRNTHGYKQPVPFPQQAVLSRKTQWHCRILHTTYFFWGIESHNPWETKIGEKTKHHGNRKMKKHSASEGQYKYYNLSLPQRKKKKKV